MSDAEILEAKAVVDASGVGCEPASAASVAGARQLVSKGVIRRGDRVVAVLTGHILKDPDAITRYHGGSPPPPLPPHANPPIEIEPQVAEIARVLSARG